MQTPSEKLQKWTSRSQKPKASNEELQPSENQNSKNQWQITHDDIQKANQKLKNQNKKQNKPQWKKQWERKPQVRAKKQQQENQQQENEQVELDEQWKPIIDIIAVSEQIKAIHEANKKNNPEKWADEIDPNKDIDIHDQESADYYINALVGLKVNTWRKILANQLQERRQELIGEIMPNYSWNFVEKDYIMEQIKKLEYNILGDIIQKPDEILSSIRNSINDFINSL